MLYLLLDRPGWFRSPHPRLRSKSPRTMDGKRTDNKKTDNKKTDNKRTDDKKMDVKKMNDKKVDDEKVDDEKVDDEKVDDKKIGGLPREDIIMISYLKNLCICSSDLPSHLTHAKYPYSSTASSIGPWQFVAMRR